MVDQNCDGTVDENPVNAPSWYQDADGDQHGDPATKVSSCSPVAGFQLLGDDCDDANASIHPAADEICDGVDQNCDRSIDENPVDGRTFYADADADGFGDNANSIIACSAPSGYSFNNLDCDDSTDLLPTYVDLSGMKNATGTLADPQSSIQWGIDNGSACIVVGPGTFQEDLSLSGYTGVIQSLNGSWDTTLEGLQDGPVVQVEGGAVTLRGLTITGAGAGDWNFIDNQDGSCYGIQENLGGGLFISGSTVALEDVVVEANDIRAGAETSPRPECSSLVESMGGGIYADSSYLILDEVQLADNSAEIGAALAADNSVVTAHRVRVTGTPGDTSSDVAIDGGSFTASNILFNGPSSTGLLTNNSTTTISQALFGGYKVAWSASDVATVTNSIFVDNGIAMDGAGTWSVSYTDSYNNASNWPSTTGAGNIQVDPQMSDWTNDGDASNDNYVLLSTSALVNAGDPSILDNDGTLSDIGPMGGPGGW
jgi:hypothetical protein